MTATVPAASSGILPDTMTLTVAGIDRPTDDIRTFCLTRPDDAPLPGFVAGSHLVVHTPSRTNAYSLVSDGTAPVEYRISVLRVADGQGGSRWLHDEVSVGDRLTVSLPRTAFAPIARARRHLLIAGGIGITPMVSHLRAARRWGREVRVLYTFRPGAGAHLDDVADLAAGSAEYFTGRGEFITALDTALADQPIGTHLYVCGPSAMIDHVVDAATRAGWPSSRIHFERFGVDALEPGDPFRIHLADSGVTVDVPAGVSALEALEDSGVSVPNRCRQGVCGECRIPLRSGEPVHRDLYLSDDEKESGEAFMPCVSRACDGMTLEVSL